MYRIGELVKKEDKLAQKGKLAGTVRRDIVY